MHLSAKSCLTYNAASVRVTRVSFSARNGTWHPVTLCLHYSSLESLTGGIMFWSQSFLGLHPPFHLIVARARLWGEGDVSM